MARLRLLAVLSAAFALIAAQPAPSLAPACPPPPADRMAIDAARTLSDSTNGTRGAHSLDLDLTAAARFCREFPQTVLCAGGAGVRPTLQTVRTADTELRARFSYQSDYLHYGVDDRWAAPTFCGDCEDYALTLSEMLHKVGASGESMYLMGWMVAPNAGHATLLVDTADAGEVEISVGPGGEPRPMDWNAGTRIAYMRMDGARKWTLIRPEHAFIDPSNDPRITAPAR